MKKPTKKYADKISLYPLKPEEALAIFMRKPKGQKKTKAQDVMPSA